MEKYIINNIFSDGYERYATVERMQDEANLVVHFLEFDEYLEFDKMSKKRKRGDLFEGDLSIELVTYSKKTDRKLNHHQGILNSSHIEAVVKIIRIVDEYSVYALSSIVDDKILIEFESAVNYKVGDKILVIGSLEIVERSN